MQTIKHVCVRVCTHIESQSVCTCPVNEYFDCVCVCVCVQFIVKQSRRLTALVEFVAATFVVVITIVYELHAQQHSLSAPIAVIHYTNFVNDNGYCCCWRSNTFTERERERARNAGGPTHICTYVCSLALHSASVAVALPLSFSLSVILLSARRAGNICKLKNYALSQLPLTCKTTPRAHFIIQLVLTIFAFAVIGNYLMAKSSYGST